MIELISFPEALQRVPANKNPYLLLGNGFSRACRNNIFAYDALFQRADFAALSPSARQAFEALATTDFEVVMRGLRAASSLVHLYGDSHKMLAEQLRRDADGLREVLVATIANSHPERPGDIAPEAYAACKVFLSHFGRIYTLNYDLLLYWTLMQDELEPKLPCDDGFRAAEDDDHENPYEYVTYDVTNTNQQCIFFLHGALHLFDAGREVVKFTWCRTGISLIDQVRDALARDYYPLFVAEGKSDQKLARINHSDLLSRAYRSIAEIGRPLFIYGHSLAPNDEHIFRKIERGKVRDLFISIYGDPNGEDNRRAIARALRMRESRPKSRPLNLHFYDAASAHVWG